MCASRRRFHAFLACLNVPDDGGLSKQSVVYPETLSKRRRGPNLSDPLGFHRPRGCVVALVGPECTLYVRWPTGLCRSCVDTFFGCPRRRLEALKQSAQHAQLRPIMRPHPCSERSLRSTSAEHCTYNDNTSEGSGRRGCVEVLRVTNGSLTVDIATDQQVQQYSVRVLYPNTE